MLLVLATTVYAAGYLLRLPCHGSAGFNGDAQYTRMCYSDIPYLFQLRGFVHGFLPYVQTDPSGQPLEYPVLTGWFMQLGSWLTGGSGSDAERALRFYDWNALLLFVCLLATVVCTALTVRRRPWDALLLALAPAVMLTAFINWDLLAVALTAGFVLAWARNRPVLAGVLLGLAVAAKFYPLLILGPLLLVCWRTRRWGDFWRCVGGTVASWVVVNAPVYLANPDGWWEFYRFSSDRGEDFGSPWYAFRLAFGTGVPADVLNEVALVALVVCCAGIAVLAWKAPRPPRLAQLAFLVIAAFCLTNKVYSPQYVLWLVPLAVLARPRWRDFLVFQAGEVVYFVAIWWFLEGYGRPESKGLPDAWYAAAVLVHVLTTLWFAFFVCRDVMRPELDPVQEGREAVEDDPVRRDRV